MMQSSLMNFSILVVDDCSTTLAIVAAILRAWNYQVVTSKHPIHALSILRARKGSFDLVMTDYHMPDMNGLELQRHVREEFNLPVIIMSGDDRQTVILKSLEGGAVFYIVKPVRPDDLKNVWQYCVANKKGKSVLTEEQAASASTSASLYERIINKDVNIPVQPLTLEKEGSTQDPNGKKRIRDDEDENDEGIDYSMTPPRKSKVVWTTGLHDLFLHAINYIGLDKAVPKRILEFMNVPGLTRENIASHLQKYRIFLKKVAVVDNGAPRAQNPRREAPSLSSTSYPRSLARGDVQQQMNPDSFPRRQPQPPLPEIRPRVSTQELNNPNCSATPVRFSPQDASGVGLSMINDPVFGSPNVYNNPYRTNASSLQVIRPNTEDISILKDPVFAANSSVSNNPYRIYASTSQAIPPNSGGPRNQQIPSFGRRNVMTGLSNPKQVYPPQDHSSSSGDFMHSLSNIAHYPYVNSQPNNTDFWDTQMTGEGGITLDGNKGFLGPVSYDNFVTSSSNFGEGSSSMPYIGEEAQQPSVGFHTTGPLPTLVFPAAGPESPLFPPSPTTQPPVATIEPRNAHERDLLKNAPIFVNGTDQQQHGDGDLFYLVFSQSANKGQGGIPHQGVKNSSPATGMNGPSKELQRVEISDSCYQLDDVALWIDQDIGQANQLSSHAKEASENRPPLPSSECSNQRQGNNGHGTIPLPEPTTLVNDLFADEESYPNLWDEDFIDALLTGSSPFL